MSFIKVKKIVAQILVVSLLLPGFNVQAVTNAVPSQEKIEEGIMVDSTENTKEEEEAEKKNSISENNSEKDSEIESEKKSEESSENEGEPLPAKGTKYEKKKAINPEVRTFSMADPDEPEEYKLKRAALEDLEVLVPLTDKDYELTIANSDGSYEFVDAFDTLAEAKTAADELKSTNSLSDNQVPEVINYSGNPVYTTNQMGRLIIYTNNSPKYSGNVNLYTDSTLTKAFTYVNVGSVEDVPILETTSTAAKIMVSGFVGWIPNNVESGTYNVKAVSANKATNPSYYTVKNGELVHYLSFNLEAVADTSGFPIILGKAPAYLKEGRKYLSYDGKHFYEYTASNLATIYDKMVSDYKGGVRTNSVNNGNPFYLYYLNLPFRSKTVYSASELNSYINNIMKDYPNSKLKDLGQTLKDIEAKYGINALLTLGVAINESGYGNSNIARTKNNLFGLKAYDSNTDAASSFATPADSVIDFAKNYVSRGYADPADWRYYGGFLGNKNRGANVKYASDPFWGEKAAKYAYEIDKFLSGGNSNLRDTNSKQIGIATGDNSVITKGGTLLYNVTDDLNQWAVYTDTPFVINDLQRITMNGGQYYEIFPERTTPLGAGGATNKFSGNYDWNQKGYIAASNVKLVNVFTPPVERWHGPNRYDTAVKLSRASFAKAETVVIANGLGLADGLSATPIATHYNGPLLLVSKDTIPDSVTNEIKRLGAKNVVIVGGAGVVSENVENQLKDLGITKITRLAGKDRYDTAFQVLKYIDANLYEVNNIVVANGLGEADALSIAPVAGRDNMPLVLVGKDSIKDEIYNWLESKDINHAYYIGGTGVISSELILDMGFNYTRIAGANRYETNAKVVEKFYGNIVNQAYITKGLPLADALTAGPVAAINESPVILSSDTLTANQKAVLKQKTTNKIIQVGGTVSQKAVQNLKELLSRTQ